MAQNDEENPVIDVFDRAILKELSREGRLSWRELGLRVGLGPTATADRVRRLERLKVISGYRAKIDYGSLGIGLRAITELRLSSQANYKLFEATLYDTPEVQAMYHVTGDVDYIILIACKDVPALDRLLNSWRDKGGAIESSTRIVLREVELFD
ncbi:MAG: Lrp/AsnC family transcriptional regulator [Microthrixaceae bacterium]